MAPPNLRISREKTQRGPRVNFGRGPFNQSKLAKTRSRFRLDGIYIHACMHTLAVRRSVSDLSGSEMHTLSDTVRRSVGSQWLRVHSELLKFWSFLVVSLGCLGECLDSWDFYRFLFRFFRRFFPRSSRFFFYRKRAQFRPRAGNLRLLNRLF